MPRSKPNFGHALSCLAVAALWVGVMPAARAQTSAPANKNIKTSNRTQIGDLNLSNWTDFTANVHDLPSGHFTGANILVETLDKTRHIRLRILTNDILGSGKKDKATVQMSGNLRYTITETTKSGDRVLNGTASRAVYTQGTQRLRLLGGVNATLADPTQFDKPATIHAGIVTVYTGGTSMRYTLAGAPGANDLFLSQRGKPRTVKGVVEPPHATTLHVYNYDSADFTVGQSASFNGAGTTADAADLEAKTTGSLRAPHIEASFASNSAGKSQEGKLLKASASGGVRYTAQRPGVSGSTQMVTGTSQTASYDVAQNSVVLDGGVEADITDTDALKSPAHFSVGKLVALMTEKPQYLISGAPQRTQVVFTPKPAKKKSTAAPKAANVPAPEQNAHAVADAAAPEQARERVGDPAGDRAADTTAQAVEKAADLAAEALDQGAGEAQNPDQNAANQNANDKKVVVPPFEFGTITISGFSSGVYEPGKAATLLGPETTFASSDKSTRSSAELKAEKIVATFSREGDLETTTATKNVHYKLSQPSPSGKVLQDFAGTGRSVIFSNSQTSQQVVVAGPYHAEVTDPETLEGAARIDATDASDNLTFNLTTKQLNPKSPNRTTVINFKSREPAVIPKLAVKSAKPGTKRSTAAKEPNKKTTVPGK